MFGDRHLTFNWCVHTTDRRSFLWLHQARLASRSWPSRSFVCHQSYENSISTTSAVVKVPLDARERSSCTSNYWNPAFPHLKLNKKRSGAKTTCLEAQSWRTVPSPLIFHFKHWTSEPIVHGHETTNFGGHKIKGQRSRRQTWRPGEGIRVDLLGSSMFPVFAAARCYA